MSEEFTQEELFDYLEVWAIENDEHKAVALIKEIVEKHFRNQGLPEKRTLTIEEVIQAYPEQVKQMLQQKLTVTMTEIENAVGDTSDEYTEGVVELFEAKGFTVETGK